MKNTSKKVYKYLGISLVIVSFIGFLTIADDLRHIGEFLAVSSILISGIIFIVASMQITLLRKLPIQWIGICLLLFLPVGAFLFDNMFIGIGLGLLVGSILAFIFNLRNLNKSETT